MARGFLHERLSYAYRHPKPFTILDICTDLNVFREPLLLAGYRNDRLDDFRLVLPQSAQGRRA